MNDEFKLAPGASPTDNPVHSEPVVTPGPDEAEMANLTLDLQKIEGYDPADIVASQSQPILQPAPAAPSAIGGGPKNGKKKFILLAVAAVVVLSLGVGGWAACALWYQSPDKVITDALINTVTAKSFTFKGTMTEKNTDGTPFISISLDGQGGYKEGATATASLKYTIPKGPDITVNATGVRATSGDLYFKLSNLDQTYSTYLQYENTQLKQSGFSDDDIKGGDALADSVVKPALGKINNQWLNDTLADMKKSNDQTSKEYICYSDVINGLINDKSQLTELGGTYQKHRAVVVTQSLGLNGGSLGFVIQRDNNASQLDSDIQNTKFGKAIKACEKLSSSDSSNDTAVTRMELWIDQWSHQLTRLYTAFDIGSYQKKQTATMDFSFTFNKPVTVTTPKDSKPFSSVLPNLKAATSFGSDSSNTGDTQGLQSFDSTSI